MWRSGIAFTRRSHVHPAMFPPCSMTIVSPSRGPCSSGYVARIVAASKASRIVAESSPSMFPGISGFIGFLPFSRPFAFMAFAGFAGLPDMFFSDMFIFPSFGVVFLLGLVRRRGFPHVAEGRRRPKGLLRALEGMTDPSAAIAASGALGCRGSLESTSAPLRRRGLLCAALRPGGPTASRPRAARGL